MLQTLQDLYKCLPLHCKSFSFSGKCSATVVLIGHKSVTFIILDCTMFPPPWQYTIPALGWQTFLLKCGKLAYKSSTNLPTTETILTFLLHSIWNKRPLKFALKATKTIKSDNLVQKRVSYTQIWNRRLASVAPKRAGGSQWADVFLWQGGDWVGVDNVLMTNYTPKDQKCTTMVSNKLLTKWPNSKYSRQVKESALGHIYKQMFGSIVDYLCPPCPPPSPSSNAPKT